MTVHRPAQTHGPTPEQMIDIEDEIVRSIGLQDHKRISAIHQNTKCGLV
jgi:hypothetical protein